MKIYKQHLSLDFPVVSLPEDGIFLCLQDQGGKPTMWYVFDETRGTKYKEVKFTWVATGEPFSGGIYYGTWQAPYGLVWHLFEIK